MNEAKVAFAELVEDDGKYVAFWPEFGCITLDQLSVMERIFAVKNVLREVGYTLNWIEKVSWKETDLQVVQTPFGDESAVSKRKGALMKMSLGVTYLDMEATSGSSLLAYREDVWLNSTCMITGMKFLEKHYSAVGVVNPAFFHFDEPASRIKIASAFHAFEPSKTRIIGALNVSGSHWVSYLINKDTQTCLMFDPMQGPMLKTKKALCEIVVPLMHMDGEVSYQLLDWCRQKDGSSCGILYEVYGLIPYLRLRYLNKCIELLAQGSEERGVRL
eukprot:jgi/Phyca11/102008/e_gw1.6.309.1